MIKKYLDSNIFINPVLYNDETARKCKKVLDKIISKEIIGITSFLTWDELVYVIGKNLGRELAISEGEKFLKFPNLIFIDVNKNILIKAQKILSEFNIKPRDSIHAATALMQKCEEIFSVDSDFKVIKELKLIDP